MNLPRAAIRLVAAALLAGGVCGPARSVPHEARWGIYALEPASGDVRLIYSAAEEISSLHFSPAAGRFAFSRRIGGTGPESDEICTVNADGTNPQRLTDNGFRDVYPCWSPDGTRLAFLSWRDSTLDIYVMDVASGGETKLYDSGRHDADIDWVGDVIVFTTGSRVWRMNSDGTGAVRITNPPRAGEWGRAVLPFGDYDPRLNPAGTRIVFERMVNDASVHGNYELYAVNPDGSGETALTASGYTQGLASWSHRGDRLAYMVSAAGDSGVYDIFTINPDGTGNRNVTPGWFPAEFLCRDPVFAADDSEIYFVGEWWE